MCSHCSDCGRASLSLVVRDLEWMLGRAKRRGRMPLEFAEAQVVPRHVARAMARWTPVAETAADLASSTIKDMKGLLHNG
jgi:hypothetical protein